MKKTYIIILLGLIIASGHKMFAQVPLIQKVEPLSTYPMNTILISGSGFSSTSSQLQVWFGPVKGTIISSTDYSITVEVPAQATVANIEVINLATKLSAKANWKFMPSFSGEPFDAAKFTSPLSFSSAYELGDLCSCDLNNDSKPDIIATKFKDPATDLMLLQNTSTLGSASFNKLDKTNLSVLDLTFPTENVTCGDLQGDGKPDLVLTRSGANSIHILTNTSAGSISFATRIDLFLTSFTDQATRAYIKDLNGDGKPEILVTSSNTDVNINNNFVYVFINQSSSGNLSFNSTPVKIIVSDIKATYSLDVQDMNNDGLADIIVTYAQTSADIYLLKNRSAGTIDFASAQKITAPYTVNRITTADINNDGLLDLIATSSFTSSKMMVFLNKSTASGFSFPSTLTLTLSGTSPQGWGVDISDIDGDGDPDLIFTNRNSNVVTIFIHNGNFSLPSFSTHTITMPKFTRSVLAGDVDGDGKPDLAFTSFNTATSSFSLDILRNKNCHQPKILNTEPLVICAGQTLTLNAVPALNVSFTWKESGSPVGGNNSYLDITTPGTYTVTASGESTTCTLTSASVTVTSNPSAPPADPTITASTPVCSGSDISLKTGSVTNATYVWTGPNNFTSSQQNPTITNVNINNAGVYTLQVIVGSCKSELVSSQPIDVADFSASTISSTVASNMICNGSTLTLSVPNDPNYGYEWFKDGVTTGQTNNSLVVNLTGNYYVAITNKNIAGCTRPTSAVSVKVLTMPQADFLVKATACVNETITFTDNSSTDPAATVVYSWDFNDTNNNTSAAKNPTHNYAVANTYLPTLQVSYSGVAGCSDPSPSKSITIKNSTPPTIVADANDICPNESTNLSIAAGYTSISWSTGSTALTTSVNAPGNYTVNANDANGCSVTDDITIGSKEVPTITVTADKTSIASGNKAQLEASGADTYSWEPAETLDNPAIANPIASPTSTTTYTVTGTLTLGCSAANQITITVDGSKVNIVVPPAFSPNGDGSNDVLAINGITDYPNCTLNIFDGRGRRIFQAKGNGDNWDGTYQGKPVPDGTYYYVFGCPDAKPVTGSILVFR